MNLIRLLVVAMAASLMPVISVSADMRELLQMSEQLDQLDHDHFDSLIRKANTCTSSRSYACAESHLSQARKYATTRALKTQLDQAYTRLGAEREAQAEEEREAAERRRLEREERLEQEREEREEREREYREREAARQNYQSPGVVVVQNNNPDQQLKQFWAKQNTQLAQRIQADNARRSAEAESEKQRIQEQNEARRREAERAQARIRDEASRRQAEQERRQQAQQRSRQEERDRLARAPQASNERALIVAETSPGVRVITPPVYKECPAGYTWYDPATGQGAPGGTCVANPAAAARTTGQQSRAGAGASSTSSGDGRTGSQNNQESGTTSGSGSGAGDSGKVQGKPRQEDGNHPNGEGGSAPTDTPPKRHGYVYKTVAIGTEWKSCEFTREGAQTWARRGLESEASRACALLGPGWGRDKIEFPGYEQALVCSGGNKWRYKITDAIARCQKME